MLQYRLSRSSWRICVVSNAKARVERQKSNREAIWNGIFTSWGCCISLVHSTGYSLFCPKSKASEGHPDQQTAVSFMENSIVPNSVLNIFLMFFISGVGFDGQ